LAIPNHSPDKDQPVLSNITQLDRELNPQKKR